MFHTSKSPTACIVFGPSTGLATITCRSLILNFAGSEQFSESIEKLLATWSTLLFCMLFLVGNLVFRISWLMWLRLPHQSQCSSAWLVLQRLYYSAKIAENG